MSAILAGRRILVVEDEMLVAMSIEDTLIDAGGEVVGPAPTVGRALGLLQDEAKIDAVVLDMNLQGHSGLPVADACDERSIPFLILSGYGDTALSGTRHAAPILSKPFASAVLVKALTTLFEGSRS
ncbi:response regulator (plasmid) [Sinorhizobium chiapasense]|uniref:response regulator n=1 Tax=Sinorhizobium chiapasense TaxID=501572 RepID=UPI002FDF3A48